MSGESKRFGSAFGKPGGSDAGFDGFDTEANPLRETPPSPSDEYAPGAGAEPGYLPTDLADPRSPQEFQEHPLSEQTPEPAAEPAERFSSSFNESLEFSRATETEPTYETASEDAGNPGGEWDTQQAGYSDQGQAAETYGHAAYDQQSYVEPNQSYDQAYDAGSGHNPYDEHAYEAPAEQVSETRTRPSWRDTFNQGRANRGSASFASAGSSFDSGNAGNQGYSNQDSGGSPSRFSRMSSSSYDQGGDYPAQSYDNQAYGNQDYAAPGYNQQDYNAGDYGQGQDGTGFQDFGYEAADPAPAAPGKRAGGFSLRRWIVPLVAGLGLVILIVFALLWLLGSGDGGLESSAVIQEVEVNLQDAGFDPGPIDGVADTQFEKAVSNFQAFYGFDVTGVLTQEFVDELRELAVFNRTQ